MAKIHDVEQGSVDWYNLRIGIPTASNFDKIITPGGKLSESSDKYMDFLIAEKLLNRSLESLDSSEWMERGVELEPQAVKMYEFENSVETKAIGFMTTDDGQIGASPDRLIVGAKAAVEIKCPAPQTHIGYMRKTFNKAYKCQVQGQIYVGDFDYVDRYSFHPELPPVIERTYRDEQFITMMAIALREFNDRRLAALEQISKDGFFDERKKIMTPVDVAYAEGESAARMLRGI